MPPFGLGKAARLVPASGPRETARQRMTGYAELARLNTVAIGGTGFSDDLAKALSPYFYSAGESSTQMEEHFANLYCSQMTGSVQFAGHQNRAQDFNGKPRVLDAV